MKKVSEIRSIFAAVALLSFLLVELFSFVRGYSLTTILVRGVGVYVGIIFLGAVFIYVVKSTDIFKVIGQLEKDDSDVSQRASLDIKIDDSFDIDQNREKKEYNPMEDIKEAVAKNPKEIASAIKKMMGHKK
jgi:hypothetical protein